MKTKIETGPLDAVALGLVTIGALNWGIVGTTGKNLVRGIFGKDSFLGKAVYTLVGVAGAYTVVRAVQTIRG